MLAMLAGGGVVREAMAGRFGRVGAAGAHGGDGRAAEGGAGHQQEPGRARGLHQRALQQERAHPLLQLQAHAGERADC